MARIGTGESRYIRLFFLQESGEGFREEERQIPRRATLAEEVRVALHELATPGSAGAATPLPPGTQVLQVFVDSFGIAYLDLSQESQRLRDAAASKTEWAIASVVTTLTTSFQEIKRVQFLSEGQELRLTVGPLDLRYPLRPRFPGAEESGAISPPQE
jgi:spore germination protein GerM